jgi:hypothetical protein
MGPNLPIFGNTAARSVFDTIQEGERSAVLVYRDRWYPAAPCITSLVCIIRAISRECRENGAVRTG